MPQVHNRIVDGARVPRRKLLRRAGARGGPLLAGRLGGPATCAGPGMVDGRAVSNS
ncbi:MAG TPA: hypothetical protein VKZ50_03900 [bacterium]|nr:hypothetical protein [bacterium]